jgi:hypothetical protein
LPITGASYTGKRDFLVLAPQYGLFALEVKGGGISRKNGKWQFYNKYGLVSVKTRGPFEQASEGIFSVMDAMRKKFGADSKLAGLIFGSGAMFPDIVFDQGEIDAHQWQIFDKRDKENVKGYIHRLAANVHRQWEEKYKTSCMDKIPDKKDIKELAQFLRGDFDKAIPLDTRIKAAEDELLTRQQSFRHLRHRK